MLAFLLALALAAAQAEPPQPRANLASYVRRGDYPARALRQGWQGIVLFELSVAPSGRVAACRVTASSGVPELDSVTCSILTRRARFRPARDAQGEPVWGSYAADMRWRIPQRCVRLRDMPRGERRYGCSMPT